SDAATCPVADGSFDFPIALSANGDSPFYRDAGHQYAATAFLCSSSYSIAGSCCGHKVDVRRKSLCSALLLQIPRSSTDFSLTAMAGMGPVRPGASRGMHCLHARASELLSTSNFYACMAVVFADAGAYGLFTLKVVCSEPRLYSLPRSQNAWSAA